jgi:vesicular inhibitory amino acid transporter
MALGFFIVLPTTFMPLRWLAVPSVLSTAAVVVLIGIILFDGLWKKHAPGSLLDPMPTRLGPEMKAMNWVGGVGLVLAGYGGHAVIPAIAKDARNPAAIDRLFNISFTVAGAVAAVSGAMGYLMMGDKVSDEISKDMMNPIMKYPETLNQVALWMIVLVPLTKYGLTSRPLHVAVESFLGIAPAAPEAEPPAPPRLTVDPPEGAQPRRRRISFAVSSALTRIGESDYVDDECARPDHHHRKSLVPPPEPTPAEGGKGVARAVMRIVLTAAGTVVAIVLPGFEKVMAFLG